jgi:glycosyltransferase involved in cell wall biosynthesis
MSMLRHLDRARVEPSLVVGYQTDLIKQARAIGVPVSLVPLPRRSRYRPLTWWRSVRQLTRVIRGFGPDVVHANDFPSCQAMSVVAARLGVPRVVHARWVISAKDAAWWARRGAECVICISDWMRKQLGETAGTCLEDALVETLPDAVDWPLAGFQEDGGAQERDGGEEMTFGFAGQLIESKGLELVIEAMGRLPSGLRPRLLVAGEDTQGGGAYRRELERLAERQGVADRISWLGFMQDVSELYRRVDAMLCPSRVEPLGLIPLEAAQFNVPTLANRVGGFVETIENGVTGILVEPNVEGWAEILGGARDRGVLSRLGRAANERTRRLYSPPVYQGRLMDIYDRVMEDVAYRYHQAAQS